MRPQAKAGWQPPEAGGGLEQILPQPLAGTDPEASDFGLLNHGSILFLWFQPPFLVWYVVMAATGD